MSAALPAATAAAPATGGMSLLLPLLMSFGPSILSKLLGHDPQADLRHKLNALISPDNLARLHAQYSQILQQSPQFSQAQGAIATGANQTANDVAANLAARGIGTSGTGAVLSGLTPSLVGSQIAKLRTDVSNQAAQLAQGNIQQQISNLTGTSGPSQSMQLFGAGLESFQPYLQAYLRSRYPQFSTVGLPKAAA
jgi:hypothetical protein